VSKGIYKAITRARNVVAAEMAMNASGSHLAAALASEGYLGGYRDALDDVRLVMDGVEPQRRGWWEPELAALRSKEKR